MAAEKLPSLTLAALFLGALVLCGCGQVGPVVPPSFKIPVTIGDLGVYEQGDRLIVDFTAPATTTDGIRLKRLNAIDLEINSRPVPVNRTEPGSVHLVLEARQWEGQSVTARVRTEGPSGKYSAWSNIVRMDVLAPLARPEVKADSAPTGARLSWSAEGVPAGTSWRVYKQGPTETPPSLVDTVPAAEYADAQAKFGSRYLYSVQGFLKSGDSEVQSEISPPVSITPVDTFPPAVPSGVAAVSGVSSIDLSWAPDAEPDLRGYYVYRSEDGQPFLRQGELVNMPAWSDRAIVSGHHYRYEVSAVDQQGNESARSAPAEAAAP